MQLSERMEKLLIEQKKAEIVIGVLITVLTVSIFFKTYTISGWGLALLSLPLMAVLNFVANRLYATVLRYKHFGSNTLEYIKELEEAADYFNEMADLITSRGDEVIFETREGIISHPEKSIGTFLDAPIYDQIEMILEDGKTHHFTYHSCIRPEQRKTLELAPDQILIEPGIIYQVDSSVNTDA